MRKFLILYILTLVCPCQGDPSCPEISESVNFHTAHPPLLVAIVEAYTYQSAHHPEMLQGKAYYEFGVFQGFSIWFAERISRLYGCEDYRFLGFDSFLGLPESDESPDEAWSEGRYYASKDFVMSKILQYNGNLDKMTFVEGWYSTELFNSFEEGNHPSTPGLVVIDCDLYESCNFALEYIMPKVVPGTILLFDEYYHGGVLTEKTSFEEYLKMHPEFLVDEIFAYDEVAAFVVKRI